MAKKIVQLTSKDDALNSHTKADFSFSVQRNPSQGNHLVSFCMRLWPLPCRMGGRMGCCAPTLTVCSDNSEFFSKMTSSYENLKLHLL